MVNKTFMDTKIEEILKISAIEPEVNTKKSLLCQNEFICLNDTMMIQNYSIVRSEIQPNGYGKILYYLAIAYKGIPKPLPIGTPQITLPIQEVKLNR